MGRAKDHKSLLAITASASIAGTLVILTVSLMSQRNALLRPRRDIIPPEEESLQEAFRHKRQELQFSPPIRHLDPKWSGIPVGHIIESPICPPPPATRSLSICYLPTCRSHQECPNTQGCCFNGCIHTCMDPLDRPAAFDWIEDTNKILPILGENDNNNNNFLPIRIEQKPPASLMAAEGEEEEVFLPGGCIVTASQHKELKQFMKASSIKDCRCNGAEVVCDVNSKRPPS